MEVILLEDIADLGKKYDTVEVADGYGMNYLLPEKKARAATDRAKAQVKEEKKQLQKKREQKQKALESMVGEIDGETIAIERPANDNDQLFAGIDAADIAELINDELGTHIEESHVVLDDPIKSVGEFAVKIEGGEKEVTINLEISAEE